MLVLRRTGGEKLDVSIRYTLIIFRRNGSCQNQQILHLLRDHVHDATANLTYIVLSSCKASNPYLASISVTCCVCSTVFTKQYQY